MSFQTIRFGMCLAGALAGAMAVVTAACGDSESPTPSNPTDASMTSDVSTPTNDAGADSALPNGDDPVNVFCEATLALYAPKTASCCDRDAAPKQYDLDYQLLRGLGASCGVYLSTSLKSGRVSFDPVAAETCVTNFKTALSAISCPDTLRTPSNQPAGSLFHDAAGCADVIVGHQGEDAACRNDYECEDGLTCVGWTPNSDGACKKPPAEGQACGNGVPDGGAFVDILHWGFGKHSRCAEGSHCATQAVAQGKCRADTKADASCSSVDECGPGLRCQLGTCGTKGPAAIDEACDRPSDCQDRLYCKREDGGAHCASRAVAGTPCGGSLSTMCEGACVTPDGGGEGTCVAFCGTK